MTKLVLLGAGASFGSDADKTVVPPLGERLFTELEKRNGLAQRLPEEIKSVFRSNFELGMARFLEDNGHEVGVFQRELGFYLSGFKPQDGNLYHDLLGIFNPNRTVFASLNYDLLLERAALKNGSGYLYGNHRDSGRVRILKPHGSANFWPNVPMSMFQGTTIYTSNPRTADIIAPVRPLHPDEAHERCAKDSTLSPSMSMYAKGKLVKSCPDFVLGQQSMYVEACRKASTVHIFGVKVVPEDTHIWKPIASSSAQLVYFGGDADKEIFEAWVDTEQRKNAIFVNAYFDGALGWLRKNGLCI